VTTTLDPWLLAAKAAAVAGFLAFVALRPSPFLRVVVLCFAGQAAYGTLQDQISVRVCKEYFTVAHPRLGTLDDPTLLGIAWGILAGGSGGIALGLALGIAATSGRRPPLTVRELTVPLLLALTAQATVTAICGISAYLTGGLAVITLTEPLTEAIPPPLHQRFFAVACAHFGTYTSAVLGGVVLCVWAVWRRYSRGGVTVIANRLSSGA
jgi:hypothetical protein